MPNILEYTQSLNKDLYDTINKMNIVHLNQLKSWGKVKEKLAGALQQGFEREQVHIAFDVLVGDASASGKLLAELKDYGMAAPYTTAGLYANAQTMLSLGVASEKVLPILKALGDTAMGDGKNMDSLTRAFSQMTSTGKLMGSELSKMINAGFNPLREISRTTGQSMSVLEEQMAKGKITADMVTGAFLSATSAGGQFHGVSQQLSQSKGGILSTLLEKDNQLLLQLYDIIEPMVIPALNALNIVLDIASHGLTIVGYAVTGVLQGFNWWMSKLDEGNVPITLMTILVGSLAGALALLTLRAKVMAIWSGIVTTAKLAWAAAQNALNLAFLANPITWIIAAIIALIGVIAFVCYKVEGLGSLWDGIVGFMKHTFLGFVAATKLYWTTLINGIMIGLDKIKLGWYKFKQAVGIGDSEKNESAIAEINADIERRQQAIVDGAKKVAEHAQKAKESLAGIDVKWNSEKSISDFIKGPKKSNVIEAPSIPGLSENAAESPGSGTLSAQGNGGSTVSSISTGGSRSSTITINLKSLVENIIYQGGYEGNKANMEKDLETSLIRVLQSAYSAQ